MPQTITIHPSRVLGKRDRMLYGHFIEHFHRQIYGGIYDPESRFADGDGFRTDVLDALRKIRVPVLRWPGGCFVSSYSWKKAVGPVRTPVFDKAWRVEDPNSFGTDEYISLCRKIGCEPYICTNAGTGTPEEMSDWLEYCNLESEGEYARLRIANGHPDPYRVAYWSIGNENYGSWELGAKGTGEWGRLVLESAKLMRRVDPSVQLSAAALTDVDWNVELLKKCGTQLDWISIHRYWDHLAEDNVFASYGQAMAFTQDLDSDIRKVRGLLDAMALGGQIRIAFDEWNLRGWHHPNIHTLRPAQAKEEYLLPRDRNDRNCDYTMADAVFSACFLNTLNRNCDIVGMANFAPVVNTRGCIFTHKDGIVLRSTYHVFDLYVNYLGDEILQCWQDGRETMRFTDKAGQPADVDVLDILPTSCSRNGQLSIAIVNKHPEQSRCLDMVLDGAGEGGIRFRIVSVNGPETDSYNDIGSEQVGLREGSWKSAEGNRLSVELPPHSVQVVQIRR